jgi:hypothetical protein
MNKNVRPSVKPVSGGKKPAVEFLKPRPDPVPLPAHNGEISAQFNKYMLVYSNNFTGNLGSPWRAGGTSIGCYQDDKFVGTIAFYVTAERMHGGYVDPNGVIVVEYPIERFEDVMRTLKTFNNLYLLFVENDNQGTPLAHPVGAVMTFEMKPIGA